MPDLDDFEMNGKLKYAKGGPNKAQMGGSAGGTRRASASKRSAMEKKVVVRCDEGSPTVVNDGLPTRKI